MHARILTVDTVMFLRQNLSVDTTGRDRGDYDRERYDYERYFSTLSDPSEPEPDAEAESEPAPREVTVLLRGPEKVMAGDSPRLSIEEIRRTLSQASQRVGHSEEDRARWLVRFAVADLSQLSIGQRMDRQWEILAFMTPPDSSLLHLEIDANGEIHVPADSLHSWVRAGIEALRGDLPPGMSIEFDSDGAAIIEADLGDLNRALAIEAERRQPGYRPSWRLNASRASRTCRLVRVEDQVIAETREEPGSTPRRFEAEALRVLSSAVARFRFCRNCREPFIARKRQAYCSPTCSQTFRTRAYRAKDPERARARRRADYERAQKKRSEI